MAQVHAPGGLVNALRHWHRELADVRFELDANTHPQHRKSQRAYEREVKGFIKSTRKRIRELAAEVVANGEA